MPDQLGALVHPATPPNWTQAHVAELQKKITIYLSQVAEKGNERTIAAVTSRLERRDDGVRRAAVEALAQVAEKGNERAIAAVTARLDDDHEDVRRAAEEALAQVAEKGDEGAIAALPAHLEDQHEYVRRAAVEALAQVAERGDERAIAAVTTRLEDHDDQVRQAAVEALAQRRKRATSAPLSRRLGDRHFLDGSPGSPPAPPPGRPWPSLGGGEGQRARHCRRDHAPRGLRSFREGGGKMGLGLGV